MVIERKLKKIEDEEWREVPNSNKRYFVSNYGRFKSYAYNPDGEILKSTDVHGFKNYQLNFNKTSHRVYAHRMVAELWLEKPSKEHIYVGHKDGNLKNNHVSNLEWHTHESLVTKRRELAKANNKPYIKKINNNKLNESDIRLLKAMLQRGTVQSVIAKMFCISEMQVTRIKRGENWGHVQI